MFFSGLVGENFFIRVFIGLSFRKPGLCYTYLMLKNVIAPIQAWFLSQERCVGCGRPLKDGEREKQRDATEKIICECGRIFIYNSKTKKYRRALLEEV